ADMDIFTIKYLQAPYPKPSSLKFSSSGKHLKLMWQDNTINEEGFKIYRSFSGTNFQLIGTTPQNTSAFVDTTANIELEYQYKIVATNQAGILASDIFSYTFSGIMGNKTGVFPNYIDVSGDQSCRIVIGENDSVEIKIYDVKGNLVKLFPRQPYQAGGYQVWDGSIQGGKKTGSGIYLIKIQGDRINREFKLIIKK
ncbi:MAG: T9SS type A sorting domain-containing protein, partial [Spirochaetes bacterium]|nr:T9SS type A sorting domain-containing protein [Spirochaetota bacterium]